MPADTPSVRALRDRSEADRRGYTVCELAQRYRVSPEKVRGWLRRGELRGVDTSDTCFGKRRYVVTPEALEAFERGRSAAEPPATRRRKEKRTTEIDYYPE